MRLLVFCKAPIPGQVKTRLLPEFTETEAARLHHDLATETLADCLRVQEALPELSLELWCSPTPDHSFFTDYHLSYELLAQDGNDLGARMHHGFLAKPGPAILIGTDCPPIDSDYLIEAVKRMQEADVLLAPAEDGGYGLIGLHEPNEAIFTGVSWSTEHVLEQTLARCQEQALSTHLLDTIWDVDYPKDVIRWQPTRRQYQ